MTEKGYRMAEQKNPAKPVEAATAGPGEQRATVRPPHLAKASESGDGAVHKLLGDLETARLNLAAAEHEGVRDPDAEQSAARSRAELRRMGFE